MSVSNKSDREDRCDWVKSWAITTAGLSVSNKSDREDRCDLVLINGTAIWVKSFQ